MKPVVEVENLSKLYRLGAIGATSLRETVSSLFRRRESGEPRASSAVQDQRAGPEPNTFWSLRDISFAVNAGSIVGIVGRNGAGKSTLLKILSRITEPTTGRAVLRGRAVSLLEVGTGFHPELTGRENIFLNGAILGMKRAEITAAFNDIVAFAEVGKFIDTPVKRYSSGMYVRLAFAVAAHLEPEILIIDEVLAVGDAAFQTKCLGKMSDVARAGRTVLFVSHNMAAVQALCDRAILLEDGRISAIGSTDTVLSRYLQSGGEDSDRWLREKARPPAALQFEAAHARLEGAAPHTRLRLALRLRSTARHRPAFIAVDLLNSLGASIMQALPTATPFIDPAQSQHDLDVTIDLPPLIPGHYALTLWAGPHNSETYDEVERAVGFEIDKSPTPNRTYGHTTDHGYVVPHSTVAYRQNAAPAPALTSV